MLNVLWFSLLLFLYKNKSALRFKNGFSQPKICNIFTDVNQRKKYVCCLLSAASCLRRIRNEFSFGRTRLSKVQLHTFSDSENCLQIPLDPRCVAYLDYIDHWSFFHYKRKKKKLLPLVVYNEKSVVARQKSP